MLEVAYEDAMPWPIAADGAGHSLFLANPDYGEDSVRAWEASSMLGGSPGTFDPLFESPYRDVLINEYLAPYRPARYGLCRIVQCRNAGGGHFRMRPGQHADYERVFCTARYNSATRGPRIL